MNDVPQVLRIKTLRPTSDKSSEHRAKQEARRGSEPLSTILCSRAPEPGRVCMRGVGKGSGRTHSELGMEATLPGWRMGLSVPRCQKEGRTGHL
jgi:hypothetical protein